MNIQDIDNISTVRKEHTLLKKSIHARWMNHCFPASGEQVSLTEQPSQLLWLIDVPGMTAASALLEQRTRQC
jgi:hypothetical protein